MNPYNSKRIQNKSFSNQVPNSNVSQFIVLLRIPETNPSFPQNKSQELHDGQQGSI